MSTVKLAYALLLALGAFGLLWNLDDRHLWGDEAETAVLAQRVLEYGLPLADDGRNPVAPEGRESNARGVWVWSPWLDEYLAAGSFALFGASTWSARLPFALFALASVAWLARWVSRVYGSREIALVTTLLLVTCTPFLLLGRQCRYYALVGFAAVWVLWGLQAAIRRERAAAVHLAGALALQFYSNYVTALGSALGLLAAALVLRPRHPRVLRTVSVAVVALAVLAAPWVLYAGVLDQAGWVRAAHVAPNVVWFAWQIDRHLVPLALVVPLALFVRPRACAPDNPCAHAPDVEAALVPLIAVQLLVVGLTPLRYFRYLGPLIPPLLVLFAALLVGRVRPRALRWGLIALVVTTNLAHDVTGWARGRAPVELHHLRFLRSITRPYDDRFADVLRFLEREARPDDTLLVADPELPLIFYTGLRVVDARLRPPPAGGADWVLSRPASGLTDTRLAPPAGDGARYREIRLRVRASPRSGSRPDPNERASFSVDATEELAIFRRLSD